MLIFGGVTSSADNTSPHQESISTENTMHGEGSRLQPSFKSDVWELDVGLLSYHFTAHASGNVHNQTTNATTLKSQSTANEDTDMDSSSPYYYQQEAARSSGAGWDIPEGGVIFVPIDVNETDLLLSQTNETYSSSASSRHPFKDLSSLAIPFFEERQPSDLCIVKVEVEAHLRHPCSRQLELVLFGPGPSSGDLNYEPSGHSHATLLFDHHDGTSNSG